MIYAVEVIADNSGKFCGNALTFPDVERAKEYAIDLFCRWTLVQTWRVVAVIPGWGGQCTREEVLRKPE